MKPINAIVIPPGDEPGVVGPISQDLQTLKAIVGGYIEAVYTAYDDHGRPRVTLWCNEDGKILGLPINRRATALWYALNGGPTGYTLNGPVLVTGSDDGQGDILDVPDMLIDLWNSLP